MREILSVLHARADIIEAGVVAKLRAEVVKMEQIEPATEHFFVPGMYCRRVFRKAGTVVIGKVHKYPHFFMCIAGEIAVYSDDKVTILKPGDVLECRVGTQRATYALTDAVGVTVHKSELTDIGELEAELVEDDLLSMYGPGNKLKDAVEQMRIRAEIEAKRIAA